MTKKLDKFLWDDDDLEVLEKSEKCQRCDDVATTEIITPKSRTLVCHKHFQEYLGSLPTGDHGGIILPPYTRLKGLTKFSEPILQNTSVKAADEPPPNVRGKPLPKEEATEGWEVTEEDMEKAQAWVDRAMREAGFRD